MTETKKPNKNSEKSTPSDRPHKLRYGLILLLAIIFHIEPVLACDDCACRPTLIRPLFFRNGASLSGVIAKDVSPYADLDILLRGNLPGVTGITMAEPNTEKKKVHITNCRDYWTYREKEWWLMEGTFGITMESFFKETCNTLFFLKQAKPAHNTRFEAPYFTLEIIDQLPAEIGEIATPSMHPTCREKRNLRECLLAQGFKTNDARIENGAIIFDGAIDTLYLTPFAKGDINGDEWEDILISYAYSVKGATARAYGSFCLEWTDKDRTPQMFECVKDKVFELVDQNDLPMKHVVQDKAYDCTGNSLGNSSNTQLPDPKNAPDIPNIRLREGDAEKQFEDRLRRDAKEIRDRIPDFDKLPPEAQKAILDMQFNMGSGNFSKEKWPKFYDAIRERDWEKAARESRRKDIGEKRNMKIQREFQKINTGQ